MRPHSLRITGLTSFADPVEVCFEDVSLFALVGPTGAGKSSVIDAITLALYGRIPRLKASEIAPAISMSASECTVGLEFTVRGTPHRAVRTIRRTTGRGGAVTGASTVEAALDRLTDDGQVAVTLAGSADDMTAEVERLLGLSFEEFTRAVVLPQGEFARVLRAPAAERQRLLARLLGTGIYDRVKYQAGQHAKAATERAEQTAHQIAQLGAVTADQVASAAARVQELTDLVSRLDDDTEALAQVRDRFRDATAGAAEAADRVARLTALEAPPTEVLQLGDRIGQTDAELAQQTTELESAESRLTAAEDALGDPARGEALRSVVARHDATPGLAEAVEEAELSVPAATSRVDELAAAVVTARAGVDDARATLAERHRAHAATEAARGLAVGDACPVCAAPLAADAPALVAADEEAGEDGTGDAQQALTAAVTALGNAENDHARAVEAAADATRVLAERRAALAAHQAALADEPSRDDAVAAIAALTEQQQQVTALRGQVRAAREALQRTRQARERLREQAAALAARLDRMRLAVAALDPPNVGGDVANGWAALHAWAAARLPSVREDADAARRVVEEVQAEGTALRQKMETAVTEARVDAGAGDPRDRAVQARADAVAQHAHLTRVLEMTDRLREEESDAREQAVVGGELARLLRADQFQQWLLDEATRGLVIGASSVMRELSNARYELRLDHRNAIQVVDLAAAGAVRSIRTLSGGETFLASLALALSLAEQIATNAAGPVALESLFIDEGFGSLDGETLDMAAAAIETLGAGDRVVGVITHVQEMADRLPTRYVVRRGTASSTVVREDA